MPSSRIPRTRLTVAVAAVAAAALALTACGSEVSGAADVKKSADRTVTDATGAEVVIPAEAEKVVVLSEMDLDSALALGVKPVGLTAGRGQQGAPGYLAASAEGIEIVGAVTGPDIEKVVVAQPDVILAGQISDSQVLDQLREIAPTVVTIDKSKDWKKALGLTGEVLDRSTEAEEFIEGYDARVAEVENAVGDRAGSSVSVARYSAKGTAVMQQGVFISDVLKDLGFKRPGIQNEKGEGHSTPLSDEEIQQVDADWLFIGTLTSGGKDVGLMEKLRANAAYQELGAVKEKHTTEIDGSKWTSLGGATAAMSVLDDIEKAMKP